MDDAISIIVPTRNEEASVAACVSRTLQTCPAAEVLVIDGGRDGTEAALSALRTQHASLRYIRQSDDRGKGHAVARGVAEARGQWLVQIDGDLQFLPEEIPRLLAPLRDGAADLVLGSRFHPGATRRPGSVPGPRAWGNKAVSGLASALCLRRFTDVLAGMKAWRREVTASYVWTCDGFSYEIELPIKALRRGFRIAEVPVTTEARQAGRSTVPLVQTGLRLGRDLVRFRFGDWR